MMSASPKISAGSAGKPAISMAAKWEKRAPIPNNSET